MDTVERLDLERRRMLAGFVVAFSGWQLPAIIEDFAGGALPRLPVIALGSAAVLGSMAFIAYMFRLMRLRQRIRADAAAARALDDERVRGIRVRAMQVGFVTMLVLTAAFRVVVVDVALPVGAVLQTCLVTGVVATIAAYLVLDRE